MNDALIIDALKKGGTDTEQMVGHLYRSFREPASGFLRNKGADSEQAKDIFQEAATAYSLGEYGKAAKLFEEIHLYNDSTGAAESSYPAFYAGVSHLLAQSPVPQKEK